MASRRLERYLNELQKANDENYFELPWGGMVMRNCNKNGDLLKFKTVSQFDKKNKSLWIHLKLQIFRENGEFFGIFRCTDCEKMRAFEFLKMEQKIAELTPQLCIHSAAACDINGDNWMDLWPTCMEDIEDDDETHEVEIQTDASVLTLRETDKLFLAVVKLKGKVSFLYTVSDFHKKPFCSRCSRFKPCKHYAFYKNKVREEVLAEDSEATDYGYYWDKRTRKPRTKDHGKVTYHYEDENHYYSQHGFNKTRFQYPLEREPEFQNKLLKRLANFEELVNECFDLPGWIIPEYDQNNQCPHGKSFQSDIENLPLISENVVVYTERNEYSFYRKLYGRPSVGDCACVQEADCHEFGLWNLGQGKMVDYAFLIVFL